MNTDGAVFHATGKPARDLSITLFRRLASDPGQRPNRIISMWF
jgi:hypothetical protein